MTGNLMCFYQNTSCRCACDKYITHTHAQAYTHIHDTYTHARTHNTYNTHTQYHIIKTTINTDLDSRSEAEMFDMGRRLELFDDMFL